MVLGTELLSSSAPAVEHHEPLLPSFLRGSGPQWLLPSATASLDYQSESPLLLGIAPPSHLPVIPLSLEAPLASMKGTALNHLSFQNLWADIKRHWTSRSGK